MKENPFYQPVLIPTQHRSRIDGTIIVAIIAVSMVAIAIFTLGFLVGISVVQ